MMFCEIKVREDGREKWVDADKWFAERVEKYSKVSYKGKSVDPYPDRVKAFYKKIPKDLFDEWTDAYPNVNVKEELNKCKAWLLSNTNKAKKDFKRFTNNWLAKAMQNGGFIPVQIDKRVEKEIKQHNDYMKQASVDVATDEERQEIIKGVMDTLKWKKKKKI